jgi:hypothetical protein
MNPSSPDVPSLGWLLVMGVSTATNPAAVSTREADHGASALQELWHRRAAPERVFLWHVYAKAPAKAGAVQPVKVRPG